MLRDEGWHAQVSQIRCSFFGQLRLAGANDLHFLHVGKGFDKERDGRPDLAPYHGYDLPVRLAFDGLPVHGQNFLPVREPRLHGRSQGMSGPDKQAGRIADAFGREVQRDADDARRGQHGVRQGTVRIAWWGMPFLRMTLDRSHQQEGKQKGKQKTALEGLLNR